MTKKWDKPQGFEAGRRAKRGSHACLWDCGKRFSSKEDATSCWESGQCSGKIASDLGVVEMHENARAKGSNLEPIMVVPDRVRKQVTAPVAPSKLEIEETGREDLERYTTAGCGEEPEEVEREREVVATEEDEEEDKRMPEPEASPEIREPEREKEIEREEDVDDYEHPSKHREEELEKEEEPEITFTTTTQHPFPFTYYPEAEPAKRKFRQILKDLQVSDKKLAVEDFLLSSPFTKRCWFLRE